MEKKDVISIESEIREGAVSNTIDVYKKEKGAEDRTLGAGTPEGRRKRREGEVEQLTTTD